MQRIQTFARFVTFVENRSARLAVEDLAASLTHRRPHKGPDPIVLHGPPGTGKSHLVSALLTEVSQRRDLSVIRLAASDLRELAQGTPARSPSALHEASPAVPEFHGAGQAGLFVLEDLQHLPPTVAERL